MLPFFEYSPEVKQAIQSCKPLLALESTLITHGLPFPHNIETAIAAEQIARDHDVVPATIAVVHGKIKIGLTASELEILVKDKETEKASRRDLPFILSQKRSAGLTVASTLFCAHQAGIKVFATGGIGGVHRGDAMDISADLIELARIPMAVVCAGAKVILDLPKTLEFLETYSIPLVGYQTNTLPAFYTRATPYKLSATVNDVSSLVSLLNIHWQLGIPSSVIIANPISPQDEIPASLVEPAIIDALKEAEHKQIHGKAITPFLLNAVAQATQGKSLLANIKLIKNNVKLGAQLAYALVNTEKLITN